MQKAVKLSPNFSSIRQSLSKTQNSKIKRRKYRFTWPKLPAVSSFGHVNLHLRVLYFVRFIYFCRLYAISVFLNVRTNIADIATECEIKRTARPNAFVLNETLKVSNRNERTMKIRLQDCTRRTTRRNQRQSGNSFEEGFFFPLLLAASPPGPAAACKRVAHVCKSICTRVCMRPGKGNRPAAVGSLLDNDTARASGTCLTRSSLSPFPSSSSLSRSLLFFFPFLGEVCIHLPFSVFCRFTTSVTAVRGYRIVRWLQTIVASLAHAVGLSWLIIAMNMCV